MAKVFRSNRGERLVHDRYRSLLQAATFPLDEIRIPTRQGETFILASGRASDPPLVLFHGGSTTSVMWLGDIATWSKSFRVYAVDMIGEPGFSAPSRPSFKTDDHANWLDDVWSGLGITSAPIVGASQGGWLALDYAIRRPSNVLGLVLVAPGGITPQRVSMSLKVAPLLLMGDWGRRKAVDWAMGMQRRDIPALDQAFYDFFLLTQQHFVYRLSLLPVFSDKMLKTLKVPVLAIVGGKDVVFRSSETERRLVTCVPQSNVTVVPEAGHGLRDYASAALEFLLANGQDGAL